jgi:hypothetical protein
LVSGYIADLTTIWNKNRALNFDEMLFTYKTLQKQDLKLKSAVPVAKNPHQHKLLQRRNQLQQDVYRKDLGFSIGGAYQENLGVAIFSPEDAVVFRRKLQIGLEWDILKGGFVENRTKVKALKNDAVFLQDDNVSMASGGGSTLQYFTRIISYFNVNKIAILGKRLEMIEEQEKIARSLWDMKQITGDAYLRSLQHKTHIHTQYNMYKGYNVDSKKIKGNDTVSFYPALFDIDFGRLITYIDSLKISNDSLLGRKIPYPKLNNYANEMSLKAYSRYNFYNVATSGDANRSFVSFGLNVSAPLAFVSKQKNEIDEINYKLKYLAQNNDAAVNASDNTEYYLLNLLYEYRYKLNQYFTLLERRKQLEELIRTENVKQRMMDVEFNPNTAIYVLDDYWDNSIELLDLHQQLYGILLNIYEKVPSMDINCVISPIDMNKYSGNVSTLKTKSLYIWSKSFMEHSATFISDYVKVNEYTDLLVSYRSDKKYIGELVSFIQSNPSYKYHLMVGQNKVLDQGIGGVLDSLKQIINMKAISGLHLDVEPQAADDFKENKDAYFAKYLVVLDEAKKFASANGLQLSVSIPLNFPENVLSKIMEKCDKVYLMAYENVNPEFIIKKTAEEKSAGPTKLVMALRAKDFETRDQMEKLFALLGIENIAYHDLETMYLLDKKSIQVKENSEKENKKEK